ncbi:serine--tRNA ligase [Desulfomicrobium orale]|uniref:Serine--tRNA ligase n=1 Tax=Desulfomicrobium orale DSM 12838 TaxID=888061 RepID=A0A0X8JPM4_9BACT|nr:serine--tRNA ligase [Desulfomicrobium orale]AMD92639.1 serine--tRNA ligase [Desulfomicrobium orale DSM 12838]
MLDIKFIRSNPGAVRESLRKRRSTLQLDQFLAIDQKRRDLLLETEGLKARRNQASTEVSRMKKDGQTSEELMAELGAMSARIKELDDALKVIDQQTTDWLLSIPNVPHLSVPEGASDEDNLEIKVWGEKPSMSFAPKEHDELGAALGGLDFETAAKITGSRFVLLKGWAARMERALISFMLDVQTGENGYAEVMPPVIVNRESLTGTGQLPKFEEDLFHITNTNYYLIPTAEVPLTNIYREATLSEADLPLALCAFTPCFRSEAGSYGKDTRGMIRQHQFDKVELVRFAHPESSFEELEKLLGHAESILQKLGLHYRVVTLCSGDLGFSSAKTYDIEVWLPGQGKYREISSCSNFEDFQARRAGIRFKPAGSKKSQFVHTLNGSGLAIGRTMVAILENYQQEDGSIAIPEALRPYMGGLQCIEARNR